MGWDSKGGREKNEHFKKRGKGIKNVKKKRQHSNYCKLEFQIVVQNYKKMERKRII
jgi:hypothetical protein